MSKFLAVGQEDPMSALCGMVVDTNYEDLPCEVLNYAKLSILDTMAVTVGGSAMEGIPSVVDLVKSRGGKPESIIPFYGGKVPASEAGLAIGPMTRAMDCGDVHEEAGHCSEYTVPTLLAATGLKEKVTGKEFITAFAVGNEVLVRIGIAFKGISKGNPKGRSSGHFIFGSVAAAGKLLGLSLEELENAEGIARSMTQPHDAAMYHPPTLIVRVNHGFVCQAAINACLLAKRGITGPRGAQVLTGPRGYLGFAKWRTDPDALTKGLGEEWEMLNVMMKPYPSCKCTHTSINGLLDLMEEHNFQAEDIDKIVFDESPPNWTTVCNTEDKWNPQSACDCQFSLPYVAAVAAYDKDVFLGSYTPQMMARKEVRELMARISVKKDPSLSGFAARVHTTLKDGRTVSKECIYVKGHRKNPLTEQELINKFRKCVPYSAKQLSDQTVDSVIKAILSLEEVDDVVNALLLPFA